MKTEDDEYDRGPSEGARNRGMDPPILYPWPTFMVLETLTVAGTTTGEVLGTLLGVYISVCFSVDRFYEHRPVSNAITRLNTYVVESKVLRWV